MITGIGAAIANTWYPGGVEFEQWANFIDYSILLMCIVIATIFIWYLFSYHRSRKIHYPEDIFLQRQPWTNTLWLIFIIHGVLTLIIGLFMISEKSPTSIIAILLLAVIEAVLAVFLYWIISLILTIPARVKYVPYLRYKLAQLFGRR